MKYARFRFQDTEYYGVVEDNNLRVLSDAPAAGGQPTDQLVPLATAQLLSPVKPSKIIGVGLNYKSVAAAKGVEFPPEPILFLKPPSSVVGAGADIVIPAMVQQPAGEVELAVVIGRRCKDVTVAAARDYVVGYTLSNDVTAKDHMPKGQPWTKGKSFDTFTPLGPLLVTDVDPDRVELVMTVNGQEKQRGSTADMIFSVDRLVSFISGIMTLEPGDVILTGTPPGACGLQRGDRVELSSRELGSMVQTIR
ncbi:MAG TPA: fumarylacetoacetate hydrolase family protein [Patescibacteria group bacterium]|nr:fumarylacetoacetate hydrolase family protein [Patescibacteria group bacterium]